MKASLYSVWAFSKKLFKTTVCIYWKVTKFKMAELEFHDVFWKQANFFWKYIKSILNILSEKIQKKISEIYCVSSVGLFFSKILTLIFDKFIICSYYFGTYNNNNYNKKQKTKKNTKTVLHVH